MTKFDKLFESVINENVTDYMRNAFNKFHAGYEAGELGLNDIVDIFVTALQKYGEDAYNEIDMTLQSLEDNGIITDEESSYIYKQLRQD